MDYAHSYGTHAIEANQNSYKVKVYRKFQYITSLLKIIAGNSSKFQKRCLQGEKDSHRGAVESPRYSGNEKF